MGNLQNGIQMATSNYSNLLSACDGATANQLPAVTVVRTILSFIVYKNTKELYIEIKKK